MKKTNTTNTEKKQLAKVVPIGCYFVDPSNLVMSREEARELRRQESLGEFNR